MYIVALFHNKRRKNSFFMGSSYYLGKKTQQVGLILGFGAARKIAFS